MNDYTEETALDVTNPAPRCPVILMLDTSGSMSGAPLRELKIELENFINVMRSSKNPNQRAILPEKVKRKEKTK